VQELLEEEAVSLERFRNVQWAMRSTANGDIESWEQAQLAVLMDIRDELQALNRVMQCSNVSRGFRALSGIAAQHDALFRKRVEAAVRKPLKRRDAK
jgi:hypothetical protein